ncbi:hypothetical protein D3C80_1400090 [compost metagenome]
MAADHAGGRARRVEQDALERLAVPPAGGVAGIAGDQLGVQLQAVEVFSHAGQPLGFEVDGHHVRQASLGLQQVAGFAARCAASIEHALAGGQFQQVGR